MQPQTAPAPDSPALPFDPARQEHFLAQVYSDLGAALNGVLVLIGDRLGLYQALSQHGPMTAVQLAEKTATDAVYVREWLAAQAAGGYLTYNPDSGAFALPPELARVLVPAPGNADLARAFQLLNAASRDEARICDAFRSGEGIGWDEQDGALWEGIDHLLRIDYETHLIQDWIPALDGMEPRLQQSARIADIGCGNGGAAILMAQAYPKSLVAGFDYHGPSVVRARRAASLAGVKNLRLELATAKDFHGLPFDFVTSFHTLSFLGDPGGAARHIFDLLKPTGIWMVVEPFAHNAIEQNLTPAGRFFYAASALVSVPASKAQDVGLCLGAQAGEARLHDLVQQAGFTRFRRVAATACHAVYEIRP